MSQRMIAGVVAGPLVVVLLVLAAVMPLPYVIYRPGDTFNVLADNDGREIIQVDGRKTYRDDGELLMTTVVVTPPKTDIGLGELMSAWLDGDDAVMPYRSVYREDETPEENEVEGAAQMVSSQDYATAAALTELGYKLTPLVEAQAIEPDSPADGRLEVRDVFLDVNGQKVNALDDVSKAVAATAAGEPVDFRIRRGDTERQVSVVPEKDEDGVQRVGVSLGIGYDFPFRVSVNINPQIGGPSAGLMFSLAIYDTLTPGSLTDGETVAGTGEISADGTVGPIGGIDQKIAAARDDGAELFLVPPDNCADVADAPNGDMQLVLAKTMHDARVALEAWAKNRDADLPTCADLEQEALS
jgi:PDZ domain-containing protein